MFLLQTVNIQYLTFNIQLQCSKLRYNHITNIRVLAPALGGVKSVDWSSRSPNINQTCPTVHTRYPGESGNGL